MTLTDEETSTIKEHLLTQLTNFPEDKRKQIEEQITSMTNEQVENFIEQNKLTHLGEQCIFCSIVADKSPSFKISEDEKNIAILEINPLSKGHVLIVPKEHSDKIEESAKILAQTTAMRLKEKFKPKEIKINELKIMGHALLEVVPIYGDETKKKQATEEELKSLQEEIIKMRDVEIEEPIQDKEEIPKLPLRIP